MPSFRKDRNRWQGQIRFKGKPKTKYFQTKEEAVQWEVKMKEGWGVPPKKLKGETSKQPELPAPSNQPEHETIPVHIQHALSAMETRMVALIKEEVRVAMTGQTGIDRVDKVARAECPLPPKTGKKYHGTKVHLRARMDASLFELFEAEAKRDHGGNLSRMLDVALWHYFGQPNLSFEVQDDAQDERTGDPDKTESSEQ